MHFEYCSNFSQGFVISLLKNFDYVTVLGFSVYCFVPENLCHRDYRKIESALFAIIFRASFISNC